MLIEFIKKVFGGIMICGFLSFLVLGFFISVSNIQGQKVSDGYPLDPWILVATCFAIAATCLFIAIGIWPRRQKKGNPLRPVHTTDTL